MWITRSPVLNIASIWPTHKAMLLCSLFLRSSTHWIVRWIYARSPLLQLDFRYILECTAMWTKNSACISAEDCAYICHSRFCCPYARICEKQFMQLRHLNFSYNFIGPISYHMGFSQLNELPHFEFDVSCLSCHFGEWMTAGRTRSDPGCLLSDGVRRCSLVLCNVLNCDQRCLYSTWHKCLAFFCRYLCHL